MMKTSRAILLLAFVGLAISNAHAQSEYDEGQIDINAGLGLIPTFGLGNVQMPLSLSVDYAVQEDVGIGDIGIGGYLGYSNSTEDDPNYGKITRAYYIAGVRGTYHVDFIEGVDTYFGVLAALRIATLEVENNPFSNLPAAGGGTGYSLFAGGRYYFSENVGVFAEVGYGISIINAGLSFRIR